MPDRWLVVTVRTPSDEQADALAEGLIVLGGGAVQQEQDRLTTFVPPPADPDAFLRRAASVLRDTVGQDPELVWGWQADEDWSALWRKGLAPRRVGRRLVVTQPWNPVAPEADQLVLVIDPATAFGTGEHATTRGALRLMEASLQPGERVLDVGTGSGILALAAAALGAGRVMAVESDPTSMSNAEENLARSPQGDRIELVNAEVDDAYLEAVRGAGFDLIVANVLSGVLVPLLPGFRRALRPTGRVILGGILEGEAAGVVDAAGSAGLEAVAEDREEGWWTALFRLTG
jgi:ribosomal protein L11 methyltransferase